MNPRERRSPNSRGRNNPLGKSNERNSRGRDWRKEEEEKRDLERKEREAREEQEKKEYEEKLKNLSSPERERLEARRKKFENRVSEPKL